MKPTTLIHVLAHPAFARATRIGVLSLGLATAAGHAAAAGASDALLAVESNRAGIVESVVERFGAQVEALGFSSAALREQLMALRADQLLAASLVRDLAALNLRPAESPDALQRYVAVEPTALRDAQANAAALAYVVRIDGALKVVSPVELAALRGGPARDDLLVGYFVDARAVAVLADSGLRLKDGSGTGPQSWIGYTAGNNQATAQGSAVMAGLNNTASGPVSAVISGAGNVASGQGALIGGGDLHQAQGNYSVIVGGYGNKTTAADAVIVGGAFNENGGQRSLLGAGARNRIAPEASYSFIGGGGRDAGVGTGDAGTNAKDNVAFSKWTFIGGGTGNRAGVSGQATANQLAAVVGGHRNVASGINSFVGGGGCNIASGTNSVVSGGGDSDPAAPTCNGGPGNIASASFAVIGGGGTNGVFGTYGVVGGGSTNTVAAPYSVIGGGNANQIDAAPMGVSNIGTNGIVGGMLNRISSAYSVIGGGQGNFIGVSANNSVIAGGGRNGPLPGGPGQNSADNAAYSPFSVIGGGSGNRAGNSMAPANYQHATIGGGQANQAIHNYSTIAGGFGNTVGGQGQYGAVGGGSGNSVFGGFGAIGGGLANFASGAVSAIGGGEGNIASGPYSYIGGGYFNKASGEYSAVLGGKDNIASGFASVALGQAAMTQTEGMSPVVHNGTFVFADTQNFPFRTTGPNQFRVRATGGVEFVTGTSSGVPNAGVSLAAGGSSWNTVSDRNAKSEFSAVNVLDVLRRVVAMPVSTWRYNSESGTIRHMGPMAQDFRRLFGLGYDDRTINTVDIDGVALAAIQGLNAKLEADNRALRDRLAASERALADERLRREIELRELRTELRALAARSR